MNLCLISGRGIAGPEIPKNPGRAAARKGATFSPPNGPH